MSTLVSKYSLIEQAKRINPNGTQAQIAEILSRENPMLFDAPWLPTNDIWVNKTTRRADKPSGTKRKLNTGVAIENSQTVEVMDVIMDLQTYAEPDKDYIDTQPDPLQARMDEREVFIEGLGETFGTSLLYGNAKSDPTDMHGFAPRLGTIDNQYIFGQGGTGSDLASIIIVTWGRLMTHLVYPMHLEGPGGAKFGIRHTDMGQVTVTDATTSRPSTSQYEAYRDHYVVKVGLVVRDPRGIGRLANIESGTETSNLFDEDNLIKITNRMKINENTRMYCNDLILSQMQIKEKDKNNVNYRAGEPDALSGSIPMWFNRIPVRSISREIMVDTESAITT